MKLLIDMKLSPRWVTVLAASGISSRTGQVLDPKCPDREIMAHARSGDWVILTQDLDFGAILASTHGQNPR